MRLAVGMRVHAEVRLPDLTAVPDAIGRHALRIVQEALTNADPEPARRRETKDQVPCEPSPRGAVLAASSPAPAGTVLS